MITNRERLLQVDSMLEKSKTTIFSEFEASRNLMFFVPNQYLLKKLTIFDIFKISHLNNWKNFLCHGTCCCEEITSALFVLIYKNQIISKLRNEPSFKINTEVCYIGRNKLITKNEGLILQQEIQNLDLRKYFDEISIEDALKYLGVILYLINHQVEDQICLEKENRIITSFLIENLKKIYSFSDNNLVVLDKILYGREDIFLDWESLSIIYQQILTTL